MVENNELVKIAYHIVIDSILISYEESILHPLYRSIYFWF